MEPQTIAGRFRVERPVGRGEVPRRRRSAPHACREVREVGEAQDAGAPGLLGRFLGDPFPALALGRPFGMDDAAGRALGHLVGGQAAEASQHRDHAPFRHGELESRFIAARDGIAEAVAQHREPVRQEAVQFQEGTIGHLALHLAFGCT